MAEPCTKGALYPKSTLRFVLASLRSLCCNIAMRRRARHLDQPAYHPLITSRGRYKVHSYLVLTHATNEVSYIDVSYAAYYCRTGL